MSWFDISALRRNKKSIQIEENIRKSHEKNLEHKSQEQITLEVQRASKQALIDFQKTLKYLADK